MKKFLVDTNLLLRFLLDDIPDQCEQVDKLFHQAQSETIQIQIESITIFEIQFALTKHYGFSKIHVIEGLRTIMSTGFFEIPERKALLLAIQYYESFNLSFADTYLLARAKIERLEIHSFDRRLMSTWQKINNPTAP
jgi:predicted nucleic-acid-binding protein